MTPCIWPMPMSALGHSVTFRDFTLTTGAPSSTARTAPSASCGEFADAKISGAYLLAGKQHADTTLVVDHEVPNCASRELFKCVMDDHARGIFQGKVIVRPGAQKTDGKQLSQALLLSETRNSTPSRSSRSTPTTWSAAMARRRAT